MSPTVSNLACWLCPLLLLICSAARATICPKGAPPAATLYVAEVGNMSLEEQLFFSSLQGVVAQKRPRIYLIRDNKEDEFWVQWMLQKKYVVEVRRVDPWELPKLFKSELNGAVVPDPDLPATVNVATMMAGVHRSAICTPEIAERCDLEVKHDLRDRWQTNAEAYQWALDKLQPELNGSIVCSLYPFAAQHRIRDYLVQHKVFTFWITGEDDADTRGASDGERETIKSALAKWPANIPVIGFWYAGEKLQGITEYGGLKFAGALGKFTVCHDWATNTSVHSGIRVPEAIFRQKRAPAPPLDESEVYVAVTQFESGDAPWYWERPQLANWQDTARGTFPMGWCLGPATLDLLPDVLQWYYEHATSNDEFFCAMSGAGYMIPQYYASETADADKVWREFMALTASYMKRLDLDIVSLHTDVWDAPVQYADSVVFKRYVDGIAGLRAIFSDFGRMEALDLARANHDTFGGVPVFHTRNRWLIEGDPAQFLAQQIRDATPADRPAFLSIMALSWTYRPSMIKAAMDALGDEYVFVTPGQMAELFRQARRGPR